MHFDDIPPDNASRRAFLRRGAALSFAAGAAPWALSLAAMGEAAAQSASDYKALVCVFLYGGNDCHNTLIPMTTPLQNYQQYATIRGSLAIPQAQLAPITDTL